MTLGHESLIRKAALMLKAKVSDICRVENLVEIMLTIMKQLKEKGEFDVTGLANKYRLTEETVLYSADMMEKRGIIKLGETVYHEQ